MRVLACINTVLPNLNVHNVDSLLWDDLNEQPIVRRQAVCHVCGSPTQEYAGMSEPSEGRMYGMSVIRRVLYWDRYVCSRSGCGHRGRYDGSDIGCMRKGAHFFDGNLLLDIMLQCTAGK